MADEEQVERLKCSIREWNQWRLEHPELQPDLRRTILCRAFLAYADLSGAYLSNADLSSAVLIHVDLNGANLNDALQLHIIN